ncbi:N-acetylmuramoyl-L-alanine amidase, partial [Alphaproteobacteria bacterium]|nr:N-acetylmuramoyl-L-alanine amidase [Alphaproteobacteria bacterium]
ESRANLLSVRTAQNHNKVTRIVLDFSEKSPILQTSHPQNLSLTIQSKNSDFKIKNQSPLIRSIQRSSQQKGKTLSFSFRTPHEVYRSFWIPPQKESAHYRYVLDLRERLPQKEKPPIKKKRIIIDAGHGGRDPGTVGVKGTYEKNVTLSIAKKLAEKLQKTGKYIPILLRKSDTSLTLAHRLKKTRLSRGDLFLSLHADSCEEKDVRGLSVYTLSAVASDRRAEQLAQKENKADLIMGIDLQSEIPEVANILIDLTKRETMNLSSKFAQHLVQKLGYRVFLLRKPHRFANFFILKSADLPSVLVELGFLSNKKEASLLTRPDHQKNICSGIIEAIDSYFKNSAHA